MKRKLKGFIPYYSALKLILSYFHEDEEQLKQATLELSTYYITKWAFQASDNCIKYLMKKRLPSLQSPLFDELIKLRIQENINLITKVNTDIKIKVAESIQKDLLTGKTLDIQKLVRQNISDSSKRIKLIARDQYNKTFSAIEQATYQSNGIKEYKHVAVMDSRTSSICKSYDGRIFYYDNPPQGGLPGFVHPNCRCFAEPIW